MNKDKAVEKFIQNMNPQEVAEVQQKLIKENLEMRKEIRAVHDTQADIIAGLCSVYQLLESIAKQDNKEIPTPYVNMEYETD